MAVHTNVTAGQIAAFLKSFKVGQLKALRGIAEGIENTNYLLTMEKGSTSPPGQREYLLTLFEHLDSDELTFYLQWLEQLKRAGLPVAPAVPAADGSRLHMLAGKPAALFDKLPGRHPTQIDEGHCAAIGNALGKLHTVSLDSSEAHEGPRSMAWLEQLAHHVEPRLTDNERHLLQRALNQTAELRTRRDLPEGLIHGDLFPDNTLFQGARLSGLIDFFSGGSGLLSFDLAVAVNAWCIMPSGQLNPALAAALLQAYREFRELSAEEEALWRNMLALGALRFWVSRLHDRLITDNPAGTTTSPHKPKNPDEYQAILSHHLQGLQAGT